MDHFIFKFGFSYTAVLLFMALEADYLPISFGLFFLVFTPLFAVLDLQFINFVISRYHYFKPGSSFPNAIGSWNVIQIGWMVFIFKFFDFFDPSFQFVFNIFSHIFGSSVTIGFFLDHLSFLMIVLTVFVFRLVNLYLWSSPYSDKVNLYSMVYLVEFFCLLAFSISDLLIFFVAFEAISVPMFIIIGRWGSRPQKSQAAYLFFYYTFFPSFGVLCSIFYLSFSVHSFSYFDLLNFSFSYNEKTLIGLAFLFAFAAKFPIYPLHSWLPEAHVEAPTFGSVILASVLLKIGAYGLLRWTLPFFFSFIYLFQPFLVGIAVLSIVGSLLASFFQLDLKRVIAYSSIAHMSYVFASIATLSAKAINGAVFTLFAHGIVSAALFFIVGFLYDRYGSRSLLFYGGLVRTMPILSTFSLLFFLGNMAFPLTIGFPGEYYMLVGLFERFPILSLGFFFGVFLTGVINIWTFSRVFLGTNSSEELRSSYSDIHFEEFIVMINLLLVFFGLGVFPDFVFEPLRYWTTSYIFKLFVFLIC